MQKTRHDPSLGEIVEEVVGLTAGFGVLLLPLLVTALPGVILILILPVLVLGVAAAAPVAVAAVVLAPPYLLVRLVRRRLRR